MLQQLATVFTRVIQPPNVEHVELKVRPLQQWFQNCKIISFQFVEIEVKICRCLILSITDLTARLEKSCRPQCSLQRDLDYPKQKEKGTLGFVSQTRAQRLKSPLES